MAQTPALAEPMADPLAQQRLKDRLRAIVGNMAREAERRVGQRQAYEERWLEDLEQYHSRYDQKTESRLKNTKKSKLFINLTRPKTDAMAARLMDLLFPTDDRNWGIGPTPVPRLSAEAEQSAAAARSLREQARQKQEEAEQEGADPARVAELRALEEQVKIADRKAAELAGVLEEGRKRAELMAEEIDDQLKESRYNSVMRDVIEDACKLGTGVCKGPVTGDKIRKGWQQDESGYSLAMSAGNQPAMRYTDLWGFFPDMNARCVEDSEGFYERHLMNEKRLRKLAQLPGFDKGAIRKLLKDKPKGSTPSYLSRLRDIGRSNDQLTGDLYHVWEYSGCLSAEDMQALATVMGDADTAAEMQDVDPLTELNAIVWFCQDEVLKFSIYPYDSGEPIYSVFNLAKDEASIFGYGVPYIMRHPQSALNAAWRQMMDNAGVSSGPQTVISQSQIEPADGSWEITPFKIWLAKDGVAVDKLAFQTFNIPTNQVELAGIIQLSERLIDNVTQLPMITQGEQGTGVTKTAQGMAILMNSANVVFRRIVKNFDDDVTTPNIRRFYDWNMQFSKKEEIKGDYEVDARGSSVLLVREMQAQNLMLLTLQLGGHPIYGPMLKNRDMLKMLFKANMIPVDEILLSEEEIDALMAKAEAQQQQMAELQSGQEFRTKQIELEQSKIDAQIALAEMDNSTKMQVAFFNRETALIQMAEKMNMSLDNLQAKLQMTREQNASKERLFAAEAAMTSRNPASAGNGGYL